MAKPFYSIEEVCAKLGKTADDVKALVRAGSLREFRDAGKVFFKSEDVDQLARSGSKSDTGEILLEPVDDGGGAADELPSLSSSGTRGGTSIIGLEPLPDDDQPKKKGDTVISASGIGVFDDEELEIDSDPMAKTQISPSATSDQVSLEGTGSGSGLMDLTREADDTSLGAELLDEIYPGEEEQQAAPPPKPKKAAKAKPEPEPEAEPAAVDAGEALAPVYVNTGDPAEGLLTGLLVGCVLLMAVASTVVASVLQGFLPSFGQWMSDNYLITLAIGAGVALLCTGIGWFVGKAMVPRRR